MPFPSATSWPLAGAHSVEQKAIHSFIHSPGRAIRPLSKAPSWVLRTMVAKADQAPAPRDYSRRQLAG